LRINYIDLTFYQHFFCYNKVAHKGSILKILIFYFANTSTFGIAFNSADWNTNH